MGSPSLRDKIVSRLTGNRQPTSAELAELDSIAVALDLNENDPMWGQIVWAWSVVPRKEWLDLAHRALAAELRSDLKDILAESSGNSIGGTPVVDAGKLDEIKKLIESLAARQATPVAQSNDPAVIKQAVLSALESQKKGVVSVDHLLFAVKDAAREVISWANAIIAAVVVGLCLFIGFQFGQHVQSGSDEVTIQKLEKQVSDLTAALPKR
jgi:uncharacterized membrane protein (Fun14 family)